MRNIKIADSMLDLVGDIPLVRLRRIGRDTGAEILVKPEFLNPSGSIKDRIAKRMVEAAEVSGWLAPGSTIIEATTGNTGTALSFVAAVKGYRMTAYTPARVVNRTRTAIMLAYGSEVNVVEDAVCDAATAADESSSVHGGRAELMPRRVCRDVEQQDPSLWWARQFSNPCNAEAHRDGTALEIIEQTDGRLSAFVASVGTGGTLFGVSERLREHDPSILIVGVEPAGSNLLTRPDDADIIPGISDGYIPELRSSGIVDRTLSVTNEGAISMAHELAEKEGIFAGISSGANVAAALVIADELGAGARIVTVLPDSRDRYLEVERYTT